MKLRAKGSNDYVTMHRIPSEVVKAETRVTLAAFNKSVESLVELSTTPDISPTVREAILANYLSFKQLHSDLCTQLEVIDLMLRVIDKRVKDVD